MDYLMLVNRDYPLKEKVQASFVIARDIDGKMIEVEKKTYASYVKLKQALAKENIIIGIASAYRSFQEQREVYETFVLKYGKETADCLVAPIRTSEHHTGLAIDLSIQKDGHFLTENCDLIKEENIFFCIHHHLKDYGFILRYPKGKETITGYPYEPWHIRYIGNLAKEIAKYNITLEEYKKDNDNSV